MAIKGLNKVLKSLKKFGKEADVEIDITAMATSNDIAYDAKTNAPKNIGKLAQSISSPAEKVKDRNYKVVVTSPYGGYVEFGTGAKVQVPKEMQEMASLWKSKGGGTFEQGLQSVRDWCKNKGIEESAAYPIFMSILKKGTDAQPFLYPAFIKGRKTFLKDLKKLLKNLTAKYN